MSGCIADQDDGTLGRAPATIREVQRGGEVRQAEVDEVCLYVCRACGQIADPTSVAGREESPAC
jgi:hypothetical protein